MGQKCKVNGTVYEIKSGKTMIGGTVKDITQGKTKIGGTVMDIPLSSGPIWEISCQSGISQGQRSISLASGYENTKVAVGFLGTVSNSMLRPNAMFMIRRAPTAADWDTEGLFLWNSDYLRQTGTIYRRATDSIVLSYPSAIGNSELCRITITNGQGAVSAVYVYSLIGGSETSGTTLYDNDQENTKRNDTDNGLVIGGVIGAYQGTDIQIMVLPNYIDTRSGFTPTFYPGQFYRYCMSSFPEIDWGYGGNGLGHLSRMGGQSASGSPWFEYS